MLKAFFVTVAALTAVIHSSAIVLPPSDCNGGVCMAQTVKLSSNELHPTVLRRQALEELETRDPLPLSGGRPIYRRSVNPPPLRREVSVELEPRLVILPGMNPDIDTRLPWNRGGPRVLILKREPTDELEAQDSGLSLRKRRSLERRFVRRSPYTGQN